MTPEHLPLRAVLKFQVERQAPSQEGGTRADVASLKFKGNKKSGKRKVKFDARGE